MKKAKILVIAVIALMVIAPKAKALDDVGWWGLGLMVCGGIIVGTGAITSISDPPDSIVPFALYAIGGGCAGLGLLFLLTDVIIGLASVDNPDGIYLVSAEENTGRRNKPVFDILRHLAVVPLGKKVFVGASFSY